MLYESLIAVGAVGMLAAGLNMRRVPPVLPLLAFLLIILTIVPVRAHDGPERVSGPQQGQPTTLLVLRCVAQPPSDSSAERAGSWVQSWMRREATASDGSRRVVHYAFCVGV